MEKAETEAVKRVDDRSVPGTRTLAIQPAPYSWTSDGSGPRSVFVPYFACFLAKYQGNVNCSCPWYRWRELTTLLRSPHMENHIRNGQITKETVHRVLSALRDEAQRGGNSGHERQVEAWRRCFVIAFPEFQTRQSLLNPYYGEPLLPDGLDSRISLGASFPTALKRSERPVEESKDTVGASLDTELISPQNSDIAEVKPIPDFQSWQSPPTITIGRSLIGRKLDRLDSPILFSTALKRSERPVEESKDTVGASLDTELISPQNSDIAEVKPIPDFQSGHSSLNLDSGEPLPDRLDSRKSSEASQPAALVLSERPVEKSEDEVGPSLDTELIPPQYGYVAEDLIGLGGQDSAQPIYRHHEEDIPPGDIGRTPVCRDEREEFAELRTVDDSAYYTLSNEPPQPISGPNPSSTIYSGATAPSRAYDGYLQCLIDDLRDDAVDLRDLDECDDSHFMLSFLLQQFAVRIGHENHSIEAQKVKATVHHKRHWLAHRLVGPQDDEETEGLGAARDCSPGLPYLEKVEGWLQRPDEPEPDRHVEEHPSNTEIEDLGVSDATDIYRPLVRQSQAYQCLVHEIRCRRMLSFEHATNSENIRATILDALPSASSVSYRSVPRCYRVIFVADWDPGTFVADENYNESIETVLAKAITLTGVLHKAQALTCEEYIQCRWPMSGSVVLGLLQDLVKLESGRIAKATLSDRTAIELAYQDSSIRMTASGNHFTIADLGEQLAWITAALRSSPFEGLAIAEPHATVQSSSQEVIIKLDCELLECEAMSSEDSKGLCWLDMFRNPVLVRGFPIAKRTSPCLGLEMSLEMAATLLKSRRIQVFDDAMHIKGFSSMLVPVATKDGEIGWHLCFNADGEQISYYQNEVKPLKELSFAQIEKSRHFVGWVPQALNRVGRPDANYVIRNSGLECVTAGVVIDKLTVGFSKVIGVSASIARGKKDTPRYLSFEEYPDCLKSARDQYFILWDTDKHRGWLVNGCDLLLHAVRASLRHDELEFPELRLKTKYNQLIEVNGTTERGYSMFMLNSDQNMRLHLLPDKFDNKDVWTARADASQQPERPYTLLQDRVMALWDALWQTTLNPKAEGVDLSRMVHSKLIGWDFWDIISQQGRIEPKQLDLDISARGWPKLAKKLNATVLFARELGNLIQSVRDPPVSCACWEELQPGLGYLAASNADLLQISKRLGGSLDKNHCEQRELCKSIPLISPKPCGGSLCSRMKASAAATCVLELESKTKWCGAPGESQEPLAAGGASIFGENPMVWHSIKSLAKKTTTKRLAARIRNLFSGRTENHLPPTAPEPTVSLLQPTQAMASRGQSSTSHPSDLEQQRLGSTSASNWTLSSEQTVLSVSSDSRRRRHHRDSDPMPMPDTSYSDSSGHSGRQGSSSTSHGISPSHISGATAVEDGDCNATPAAGHTSGQSARNLPRGGNDSTTNTTATTATTTIGGKPAVEDEDRYNRNRRRDSIGYSCGGDGNDDGHGNLAPTTGASLPKDPLLQLKIPKWFKRLQQY